MKNEILESVKDGVKYWWVSLLVGLLAVILGVWCLATPDTTLIALTYVFVFAFFITGIIEISFAVANKNIFPDWGWRLAVGIIDILFAILLLALPLPIITVGLLYFVGFWILFRSIWAIAESYQLQRWGIKDWGWMLAFGILCVVFAFLFLFSPVFFKGVFVIAIVSVALILYGFFRIYLAFKLKSLDKDIKKYEER